MSDPHHAGFPNTDKTRQLVSALLKKKGISLQQKESIPKRPVYSPCPASFAQQRLWLLEQLSPGSRYNMEVVLRLKGPLNTQWMNDAWREILRRHEILRTTFGVVDDEIMQFISPDLAPLLTVVDLTRDDPSQRESNARHVIEKQGQESFDLVNGPLVRPVVLKLGAEEYVLSLTMHHIISDGWSLVVLVREFTELYASFSEGRSNRLPPLSIQYADFAWWQRQRLSGDLLEKHLSYWRRQLNNAQVLELPADHPRPQKETFRGSHWYFRISEEIAERLHDLGRRTQASLFMVLLAAWKVLLYRYSGQSDIAVGAPIANRTSVEIELLIGFFVNTLVLRTDISGNQSFKEALSGVRKTTLDAYEHQEMPYEKLVAELQPERTASQTRFFGTMLNWVNTPGLDLDFAGVPRESTPLENPTAKFDLTLNMVETKSALPASFEYSTDLYEEATIVRVSRHFQNLLAGIVKDADQPIADLPLLGEEERSQILLAWNQAGSECPAHETILELVEAQARKTPENPAVVFEGQPWSYRELHERANQLAHFLRKLGVGPEIPVGICMERSAQLVMAILGVLKAGGAYVPLDPNYPVERLRYTLENSRAPVLLIQQKLAALLPSYPGKTVKLDAQWEEISGESPENAERITLPENLAYVIYTSGSTGRPKGVAIRHSSAAVMLRWAHRVYSPQELAGVLASTSICFDLSVFEIFAPLSCGGTVFVAGNALEVAKLADAARVTLINTVPSAMRELVRAKAIPESVRTVNLAGEALPAELVRDVYAASEVERVFNLYGPSEDTTYSTYACVERDAVTVPIGHPIASTWAYILDEWMHLVPIGVVGELYLGGAGLARGYLDRSDMTAERFVPDPFSRREGERLYRTGDLTKRRSDGMIEYVGRSDHQIKLRGNRIELGEIEAVLEQHEAVQQAVVAVHEEGDGKEKRLIAYVVTARGERLPTAALRRYVQKRLPGYMVPSAFMELPVLPLTANGKVDRKALPRWELAAVEPESDLPRTPTEELLGEIWSEVLGVERIGVHANFFDLGGHSLLAMSAISRVRSALQVELPLSATFDAPTIHELAAQIEQSRRAKAGQVLPLLAPTQDAGPYPLSFAQQRLWFMDRLHPGSTFYNISGAVRLSGDLRLAALEQALITVGERHQVFRTRFVPRDEEPAQIIDRDARLKLEKEDLRALKSEDREKNLRERIEEEFRKPFALSHAPLARMILLRLDEREHVLFISMHHIVSDGWSINVLVRELTELYAAFSRGQPSPLPPLAIQYADYARWQREYLQGAVLERQLSYWRTRLSNAPVLELPTDRPRSAQENFRGAYYSFLIPLELVAGLRNLARSQHCTLFMVLLAAWQTLLYRYSSQTDFTVGMPSANRSLPEIEGLIGFFVNTLVLRSDLSGDPNFIEVLQRARKIMLEAYDHQDLPFEKLVADLRPERSLSQTPLFRVMFNWVNIRAASLKFPDVEWAPVSHQHTTANFDLTLTGSEQDGAVPAGFEYSTDLYDEPTVAQMADHLLVILRAAVENPKHPIATMSLLTEIEREQLLFEWNQTAMDFGQSMCVHELIELTARGTPEAIAIIGDIEVITYAELDRRANRIAHWLRSQGVGAETPVGVCLQRSPQMLVVLLGILKAGGAYVPLDPSYPPARLAYIVEDSELKLLLTETALQSRLASLPVECFYVDLSVEQPVLSDAIPCGTVTPENAAYIIYTSGSTGRSKGVVARHSSVANQVLWMKAALGLTSSDRVIHKASVSFDASVGEIFAPLASGAQVVVTKPEAQHDIDYLVRVIRNHKVTFIDLAPTLLRALLEHPDIQQCSTLRRVVSGGEVLAADLESHTVATLKAQLYNTYGPTETTVQSTFWACSPEPLNRSVPIGRPIANTTVYVLDFNEQPVPIGVEGELCIAGSGLARGYLNRPALTAEKFIPNPFDSKPGERMYKTGDRVRWRREGTLEFLGRIDQQVKIRGFRIEPGEIESALLTHQEIREAAVITRENNSAGTQIVAFVVCDKDSPPAIPELRQHVKGLLPFYMRPSLYVLMERLPLNANGKVDRNSLALATIPEETHKDNLPRTPTEKILCRIWADVLKREGVGVEDDFFALGGHSFLAVNLISQITRSFGRDLALDSIFQHPTPKEMARFIHQDEKDTGHAALVCMNKGSADLPPLYLVHPVAGNILCYSELARCFSRQKAFYGIQALPQEKLQHTTLEEIASAYLRLIKKREHRDSYELGGWSFGGLLAFEMAQQAMAAGDPPAALYLLDPPAFEDLPLDNRPDDELVTLFVLTLIADFSGGKPLDLEKIKAEVDPGDRSLDAQLRKAVEFGLLPASMDIAAHARFFEIFHRNVRASQVYRPQKYSGKTMLVLPETRRSEIWPTLLPANVTVVRMPGNHFTIIRGVNAAKVAGWIESGPDSLLV